MNKFVFITICTSFFWLCSSGRSLCLPDLAGDLPTGVATDTTDGDLSSSTAQQAIELIRKARIADSSIYWPHVKASLFLENLEDNVLHPLAMYQGTNTNFCGYAALSYLPLHDDPLRYVQFMLTIYKEGKATWGRISFHPSPEIELAAGTLRFKGILDIRPADQMWFLLLADHFRGYLNFFTRRFHEGSEDTFWAAVNFGKFNRMIHRLLGYTVHARGSDLIGPGIKDMYTYLDNAIHQGTTFLYVNNTYLHKKNHNPSKASFPTHFIVLKEIRKTGDLFTIIYWDYGGKTLRQVTPAFLKKITFGVSYCTKKANGE